MILATKVNERYMPGLFALLQSLVEFGQLPAGFRIIVVYEEAIPKPQLQALQAIDIGVEFMDRRELGEPLAPNERISATAVHNFNLGKLLLYRLPVDDTVCYVDADIICVNPLNGIEALRSVSVVENINPRRKPREEAWKFFNAGFMVFQPSHELYQEIADYFQNGESYLGAGDQSLQNHFYHDVHPDWLHWIDPGWNTLKTAVPGARGREDLRHVRFLHYLLKKPWSDKIYLPEELPYFDLNCLWWEIFERSGGASVLRLTASPPSRARYYAARWLGDGGQRALKKIFP